MNIPLSIAAPTAVAAIAYFNARTQFTHDAALLSGIAKAAISNARRAKKDQINIFYTFEQHALSKSKADHPFLIYEGTTWTFRQAYDTVLRYSTWLKTKFQIGPQEVVALDFMNSPKFVFLIIACWHLGATPALINYNLTSQPLLHCLKASTVRVLLADDKVKDKFSDEVTAELAKPDFREKGKGSVELVFVDAALEQQINGLQGAREPDTSRAGAVITGIGMLIFTSGTTGLPKPAIVSWKKMHDSACVLPNWLPLKKNDIFYTCMPMYHSTATLFGFQLCIQTGTTFSLGHRFSNKTFWPDVRASKATIIQYVGETCRYLLAAPPLIDPKTGANLDADNHVRTAFGNGLRPDIWDRFKTRFGIDTIAEFYGATEGVSAAFNNSSNSFSAGAIGRLGALGRLVQRSKTAIVKVDIETEEPLRDPSNHNFCVRIPDNDGVTPGELLQWVDATDIKQSFQGYFGNTKASSKKIMRDVFAKGDAWFRTGDMIRRDSEGRVYFVDRMGDTFRWRSENVSTNEVGEVLGRHDAVLDANVYGIQVPHHEGRAGCVALVFKDPHQKEPSPALMQDLAAFVSGRLPKYAVPLFLRIVDGVQATGNNKRQKHVLREQGVDLEKVDGDRVFWLKGGNYVEFNKADWEDVRAGKVKL